ncbi:DNA alkylation repair protein [Candidatus Micrarchaeota archaeon]|nr:DNA alkylation repair protein [Candidatus Micrarchaeota archaeon]
MGVTQDLEKLANPEKAKILQGFFKTGKGEYGEGDIFLGITVPQTRKIAKANSNLDLDEVEKLLKSKIHEQRLCALLILVNKYEKGTSTEREKIVNLYLANTRLVNNWDLVDLTAPKILGHYLFDKDRSLLYKLAKSKSLWERRIAIISTFHYIRNDEFEDALRIAEILLNDRQELIHKAVGWMLREIGKRDLKAEESFLGKHHKNIPRVTLRYAIERFEPKKKEFYMRK